MGTPRAKEMRGLAGRGIVEVSGVTFALILSAVPFAAHSDSIAVYGGVMLEASGDETDIVPILVYETGRLSFGLDAASVTLAATHVLDAAVGLQYDADGTLDAFVSGAFYFETGFDAVFELGASLRDDGRFASLGLSRAFEVSFAEIATSIGVFFEDDMRRRANHPDDPVTAAVQPYLGLSAFVPVSAMTVLLGEVTASEIGRGRPWIDASLGIVREF